jgi:hypothetical protein
MYDEIADINFIAYRMLRVYIDNILIKNGQTKTFLNIQENSDNKNLSKLDSIKKDFIKRMLDMFIVYFDLQSKLKNQITPKTLKYGDYYIEVVDLSPIDEILDRSPYLLTESFNWEESKDSKGPKGSKGTKKTKYNLTTGILELPRKKSKESIHENIEFNALDKMDNLSKFEYQLNKLNEKISSRSIEETDLSFLKKDNDNHEFNPEELLDLDLSHIEKIYLRLHSPANVLKIEKDGVLYGYLIIENLDKEKNGDEETVNIYKRFLSDNESGASNGSEDSTLSKSKFLADEMAETITKKIGEHISDDYEFSQLDDEVRSSIRVIIYQKLLKKSKLKFRFIETDSMVNFHTTIDKYAPYGTSIFDSIVQPVKMYTIGLMTSLVSRLSRAAVVRKWNIEVGNKRNYKAVIEQVKKDLRNKSVTYDSLSSIKNISKIITDFKDIATVTRDGQRFIDLEVLPLHDRSLPIQELQDLRNELVSATGVPSTYLNIPDAVDLRETLVNININFANTIISLQSYKEDALNNLFNIIIKKLIKFNNKDPKGFNISSIFKITLNTPLVLQLQQSEALVGSVMNIIGALQQVQLQIDPLKLLETYIPQINWKQLKKSGEEVTRDEIKKQIMMQQSGDQGQGGF